MFLNFQNFTTETFETQARCDSDELETQARCDYENSQSFKDSGVPWESLLDEERTEWRRGAERDNALPDFGGNEAAQNQFYSAVTRFCCDQVLSAKKTCLRFHAPVARVRVVRPVRRNRAYRSRRRQTSSSTAGGGGEDPDQGEPPKPALNPKKFSNTNHFTFDVRLSTRRMAFRPRASKGGRTA